MLNMKNCSFPHLILVTTFLLSLLSLCSPSKFVLHLTDIHVDVDYKEGTYAECLRNKIFTLPCCHTWEVPVGLRKAGKYGDFLCDSPPSLVDESLRWISSNLPLPDAIIWTGDEATHSDLTQSPDKNLKAIELCSSYLEKYFPGVPVYPSLGNHDTWPVNNLAEPPENSWLLKNVSRYWAKWLGNDTEAQNTFLYGGYYSTLVWPGLRLISLNNIYHETQNLLSHSSDPANQQSWFERTLKKASDNGEKVWIIGHIPPGSGDVKEYYSDKYLDLVYEYGHIIQGSFFGHTHTDSFRLVRNNYNDRNAKGLIFIAPSLTPYSNLNPSFRIYHVDQSSAVVTDIDQWGTDLDAINKAGQVKFALRYSASRDLKMANVSDIRSWQTLAERVQNDRQFLEYFWVNVFNSGKNISLPKDNSNLICSLMYSVSSMINECVKNGGSPFNLTSSALSHSKPSFKSTSSSASFININ